MKTVLLIIIHLTLFTSLSDNQVSILTTMPESVKAGEKFAVEITINKFNLQQFAEFKQDFPPGFTIINVQPGSANYTNRNQTLKFTWLRLPAQQTIRLRYEVIISKNVKGDFKLPGQFTYFYQNQRGFIEVNKDKVLHVTP